MLGNMTPTQSLDVFNQVIALATVFNDDKFVSTMEKARKLIQEAAMAQQDLDAREKELVTREKEAEVVLNSQTAFNDQHARAMLSMDSDKKTLQAQKDALAADRKAFEVKVSQQESFFKTWEADLSQAQQRAENVLKTEEKANKALADAEALKATYQAKLDQLGLKVA